MTVPRSPSRSEPTDSQPPVDLDAPLGAAEPEPAPVTPRAVTQAAATVLTAVLVAVGALLPVPYAVSAPGPTRDTLGDHSGNPLIQVSGADTYDSEGRLLLTTVSVSGGPGYPVALPMLLSGWIDRTRAVRPVEEVFAPSETQEEIDARNQAEMTSSQENATVAALEALGYEVPAELNVAEAVPGTGAEGVVEADDVIVAVDGEDVETFSDLTAYLEGVDGGSDVVLGVLRDGEREDLTITTTETDEGGAVLGVFIDPEFDFPVDVTIAIENIGGPSAGMMFALGIIDSLTPDDETGGATVAGTGTVDVSGRVGPIGGIRQKLAGAQRDGATWFLAPEANCDEVVGYEPEGVTVVRVATITEARDALEAIVAGEGATLPTC